MHIRKIALKSGVFEVRLDKHKRDLWKFLARATVDGELACEAEMMCVLRSPVS